MSVIFSSMWMSLNRDVCFISETALRKEGYDGTNLQALLHRRRPGQDLFQPVKERAEGALGESVDAVTLGRPVKFPSTLRRIIKPRRPWSRPRMKRASPRWILSWNPSLPRWIMSKPWTTANVVIFDFGGGTLDIAVMRLGDPKREVYASGGVDIAGSDLTGPLSRDGCCPISAMDLSGIIPRSWK